MHVVCNLSKWMLHGGCICGISSLSGTGKACKYRGARDVCWNMAGLFVLYVGSAWRSEGLTYIVKAHCVVVESFISSASHPYTGHSETMCPSPCFCGTTEQTIMLPAT